VLQNIQPSDFNPRLEHPDGSDLGQALL
jgi:hypothetical protein